MFRIGCHLSISNGFLGCAKTMKELGGNTFQYFSRNPQGGKARDWDEKDFQDYLVYAKENGIDLILTHSPYTLNCASAKEEVREFAYMCMREDIKRLERFDNALYNFHPGSHTGIGVELGTEYIIKTLNAIMYPEMKTTILLEAMSGKGSEIGRSFEELKTIIDGVQCKDKIGVCLDTCHVYSAGYDIVNDLDGVLDEFDRIIGLDRLKAIHLNDSKMPFNSNKDRHECIGKGTIGLTALTNVINHPKLKDLPFFLETPNELDGYKEEIALLKGLYKWE